MKEKDLLKSATDLQMPDLEQIRQNVLKSAEQSKDVKPKIFKLKPSKLLAVAAIVALSVIGTIAVVANQNGGLFAPAAEETTAETTKPKATKPEAKKKISASSKSNTKALTSEEIEQNKIKKYKNRLNSSGYSVTQLFDLGKVEGYHIVYAGNGSNTRYDCDYIIGDYTFSTSNNQLPYGLGLYACGKNKSYTLAEAYSNSIFDNFSAIADTVANYTEHNLGIEVTEKKTNSESFRNYFGGKDIITLATVKSGDAYELYFTVPENAPQSSKGKIIGDYTFELTAEQEPYDLGLYVVSGGTISNLENAVENGVIDMDTVNGAVNNSSIPFTFTLSLSEEEESEQPTEEIGNDEQEIEEEE